MTIANPIMARFQDEPCLVDPGRQTWFESCVQGAALALGNLKQAMAAAAASGDSPSMEDDFWYSTGDWRANYRPYVVKDGVLQIPVKGVLLNDFPYALGDWATGYDYIWRAFKRGMGDDDVRGIALVVDSPGGMVAGNFDLVDKMFAMRGQKPVRGYAHESAYSAAYNIISVADPGEVTVSRTGGVGSIGVVTSHFDMSKAMEQNGYRVTFIYAGKHKVDGNPYEALPADVKARIQERIDSLYAIFVSTVARNRGLEEQAVRDTEALTFTAPQALSNGLADKIGSLDDALAEYSASFTNQENETMADAFTQADIDQARAAGVTEGLATGRLEGATAERTRVSAILAAEPAAERPKAALQTALKSNMDVETAIAFIAELPAEQKPTAAAPAATPAAAANGAGAPAGMFAAAMDKSPNPAISGGDNAERGEGGQATSDDIFASAGYGNREPKDGSAARHQ